MSETKYSLEAINTIGIACTFGEDSPYTTIQTTVSLITNSWDGGDPAGSETFVRITTASTSIEIAIDEVPAFLAGINHLYQQHIAAQKAAETESDVLAQIGPSGVIANED